MRTDALRRPVWLVGWALFGAAAVLAVVLFGTDWARPHEPPWLSQPWTGLETAPKTAPRRAADYSVIWKRMAPPAPPAPSAPGPKPPPEVQNTYEVVATFSESQAASSYAVLRDRTRRQRLIRVGDRIGGMEILAITPDGVLVSRAGVQTFLKRVTGGTGSGPLAAALGRSRTPAVSVPAPETSSRSVPAEEFDWEDPFMLTREQLGTYVANLPTLLAQVQVRMHYDAEGKADGLQIVSLQPQSVAAQRGLKVGDVVKSVYDTPLTDLRQVPPLAYRILEDDPAFVDVLIERDGEEQELIYEVR